MQPDFKILDDPAGAAAALLADVTGHLCITGGSTPRAAYERVADMRTDWSGVDVWFTDERCVPPDHEHSNFRMASDALLARAEGATVHRMKGELGPHEGAADYEREYEAAGEPAFDLILLGMGPDAHICSLFPGDDALGERERPVVGVEAPGMAPLVSRITLTLPVVNAARSIVFLVTGEDKADAVARAFSGRPDPMAPASLVDGEVTVLLDPPAARRL
ncbi:MAG: 6-phosphogluconolactonase [Thermoleophilaceae bacterium]|jgi:6-phosphogluconolactonase|nr:6-phosphogluconolactonase [Thermoleophilaceae bacterium]